MDSDKLDLEDDKFTKKTLGNMDSLYLYNKDGITTIQFQAISRLKNYGGPSIVEIQLNHNPGQRCIKLSINGNVFSEFTHVTVEVEPEWNDVHTYLYIYNQDQRVGYIFTDDNTNDVITLLEILGIKKFRSNPME